MFTTLPESRSQIALKTTSSKRLLNVTKQSEKYLHTVAKTNRLLYSFVFRPSGFLLLHLACGRGLPENNLLQALNAG